MNYQANIHKMYSSRNGHPNSDSRKVAKAAKKGFFSCGRARTGTIAGTGTIVRERSAYV